MLIQIIPENENSFTHNDTEKFDSETFKEKGIVLLAYIYRDSGFKQQAKVLNDLSKTMKNIIQIFLLEEEDVHKNHEFDISG